MSSEVKESTKDVAENEPSNEEESVVFDASSAMSKTTNISTIAVQSGTTRLVIALLHCGDWLQIKILEVTPELTHLGNTNNEALLLQSAHDEVLQQLQNKQSPVEELLRQADQLISTQKPRAEVYAAMAESLGRAWKDINRLLESRKQILDLNVQYHTKAQEFLNTINALENACSDNDVPIDVETIKTLLMTIHDYRKSLLEYLMSALQTGNLILGKLRELGIEGTLDSRPDHIRISVNRAIAQVQSWLDDLHSRRKTLDGIFNARKEQLEQCLALAILALDLREVEDTLIKKNDAILSTDQLGDSFSSGELLLFEHKKLLPEAKQLQERAIKITKATEQLKESGCYAGDKALKQSYDVLSATSDYLVKLENRALLLERVIEFFKSAQNALIELNRTEMQLTTYNLPLKELAKVHQSSAQSIDDITAEPIKEGHSILDSVGRGRLESNGVKKMVEELEDKKIHLLNLCTAHQEEKLKINIALNKFLENHNFLYSWLVTSEEVCLLEHQEMGHNLITARDFWNANNRLLADLQTKGNDINALLLTLPPILEYLEDDQRRDVDIKVEQLHQLWLKLKNILENRLTLSAKYVKFHTEADFLIDQLNNLEDVIRSSSNNISDEALAKLEHAWESLVPLYHSVKNTGTTFINDTEKVSESYLDTKRACLCVESILEKLSGKQLVITRNWQNFYTNVIEERKLVTHLEIEMVESNKTITWVSKLDSQLYPIITKIYESPQDLKQFIEEKLLSTSSEIRRAQNEVEERIKSADIFNSKINFTNEQLYTIKTKLLELNRTLLEINSDYQLLTQIMISFLKSIIEVKRAIETSNQKFVQHPLPNQVDEINLLIHEHERAHQNFQEMFKAIENEFATLSTKIIEKEPTEAAKHDIDKLQYILKIRKDKFELEWCQCKNMLEAEKQVCQFDSDLYKINKTINELSKDLTEVRNQFCENLSSAKVTSQTYSYFEETVQLLDKRINMFVKDAKALLDTNHVKSKHIEEQLQQLLPHWNDLKNQVTETRELINLSIQYFKLIEKADEWFKNGSEMLINIARKSTNVKTSNEAEKLLQEIDEFLKPGEIKQNERITEISELAKKLYGLSITPSKVVLENQEMLESFMNIIKELNLLILNLQSTEKEPIELINEPLETLETVILEKTEKPIITQLSAVKAEPATVKLNVDTIITNKIIETTQVLHDHSVVNITAVDVKNAVIKTPPKFVKMLKPAEIEEGSRFSFNCQVVGAPTPKVTWLKDGITIDNNPDYRTSFENEICSLQIEETFAEDSAMYTCKAKNEIGYAETSATLTVKEIQLREELVPPKFVKPLQSIQIKEGQPFDLRCKVDGNPLPLVQWYKNNECIDNSADYVITYNNGDAKLICNCNCIQELVEFHCKATNQVGSAESTATVGVKLSEQLQHPIFIVPLSNVMARAGQKIKLECEFLGVPTPSISWMHNSKPVKETHKLKIHNEEKKSTLVITEAFPKDAGFFSAKINNSTGEARSECTVTVKGRLPNETSDSEIASDMEPIKPSIQVPLKNFDAKEKERVCLDCVIVGQPEPEVIWYHDEKPIKESSDFQLLFEGDHCSLIIREATMSDSGEYKVIALNSAGEASNNCTLIINPVNEQKELASTTSEDKPQIIKEHIIEFTENENIAIANKNETSPNVEEENAETKESDNNIEIQESEEKVEITEVNEIKIAAEQPTEKEVEITEVIESKIEQPKKKEVEILESILNQPEKSQKTLEILKDEKSEKLNASPKFEKLLSDILATEGEEVVFKTLISGTPRPTIKWLRNNEEIFSNKGITFIYEDDGTAKLLFKKVQPEHKGVYTVKASNSLGDVKCFAQLIVKSHKPAEDLKEFEEVKEPPVFKESFIDITTVEHNATKFQCIITGKPTPKIKWLFNDEPVSGEDFLISTSGDRQILLLPKAGLDAAGKITCVAENDAGKAECSAQHIVIKLEDDIKSNGDVIKTSTREIIMKSTTSSNSQVITNTSSQDPKISVVGYVAQDSQTVKQVNNLSPEIQEIHTVEKYQIGEKIPIIQERSVSTVIIKDESQPKIQNVTDQIIHKPLKYRPPKFTSPIVGKIVDQGVDVILEGIIDGSPTPIITWEKNGNPIQSEGKVKIEFEHNRVQLKIDNVNINDAGRYTCKAVNDAGSAISTSDLVIRKTTFPPVFGRRLQAQVVNAGERVTMEVEVTGIPTPDISWFKDNKPIKEILEAGCKLTTHGNSHSLVIEKANLSHSGKYMVKAINDGGEAQSIADFAVFEPTPNTMVEVVKTMVFEDVHKHETLASEQTKTSTVLPMKKITENEPLCKLPELVKLCDSPLVIAPDISVKDIKVENFSTTTIQNKATPTMLSDTKTESITTAELLPTQLSESKVDNIIKTETIQESKTFTFQSSHASNTVTPIVTIQSQNIVQNLKQEPPREVILENEGIATDSITKESSLNFFIQKLKESNEPPPPKAISTTTVLPLQPEIYTKFEDTSFNDDTKVSSFEEFKKQERPQQIFRSLEKDIKAAPLQYDFNLKPEPPAEICFAPRSQFNISDLRPIPILDFEPTTVISSIPQTVTHLNIDKEFQTPRPISPKPSPMALEMEKLWVPHKETEKSRPMSVTPQHTSTENAMRSISALSEPSMEGLAMEKTWAHNFSNIKSNYKSNEEVKSWSTQTTLEKHKSNNFERKTEQVKPAPYYIATVKDIKENQFIKESTTSKTEIHKNKIEESSAKVSDVIRNWPPPSTFSETSNLVSSFAPYTLEYRSEDVMLEPGSPPEIGFAPPPLPPKQEKPIPPAVPAKTMNQINSKSETRKSSAMWKPFLINEEKPQYRHVAPPKLQQFVARSKSVEPVYNNYQYSEKKTLFENVSKPKTSFDGYMADTDEPFKFSQKNSTTEYFHEESRSYSSKTGVLEKRSLFENNTSSKSSPKVIRKNITPKFETKKELITTPIITSITTSKNNIDSKSTQQKLEPFPYKPETYRQPIIKGPPPASPSKFIKSEFRESDYESDYEGKITPVWRNTTEHLYKPVKPILTPSGRHSQASIRTPTPPTEFDTPPQFSGPPRPKFEPIEKPSQFVKLKENLSEKSNKSQVVYKPKPVTPKTTLISNKQSNTTQKYQDDTRLQPGSPPEIAFAPEPSFTQYYRSTTSLPNQNAIQTETSNIMHFKEATESSRRSVSLQQTKKIITFGNRETKHHDVVSKIERPRTQTPKESDYDSEVEMSKIKPVWGLGNEPRYRKVQPPTPVDIKQYTSSVNVLDNLVALRPGTPPEFGYVPEKLTGKATTQIASKHMEDMSHTFKSKTRQFTNDIMTDVNKKSTQYSTSEKSESISTPQVYREDSRSTQYGTKHVDPDTGLIYFKYDFGYEFGVILPGQSKIAEIPVPKKTIIEPPKRTKDIEMPVHHESSQRKSPILSKPSIYNKNIKWEPTSESEISEYEIERKKRTNLNSLSWEQCSVSPASLSPSFPSTSPAFNAAGDTDLVYASGTLHEQSKRPPYFITPLKDIAVVSGETARFECIVQSEPMSNILWSKNGRIIEQSRDYQIFFRNGVCRLTIPQAYPEDAGAYTCTATNNNGSVATAAMLQVPGERRSQYLQ